MSRQSPSGAIHDTRGSMSLRLTLVLTSLFMLEARGQDLPPPAAPPYYRVHYDASTQPGELVFAVTYTVWIPPEVKTLRGIIVHQHGCGEGACKAGLSAAYDLHWQALARKHGCALLGPSYEQPDKASCDLWYDPRKGSQQRMLQAIDEFAAQSQHPELTTVPWALWGHSGGAWWAGMTLMLHPQRIVAVWLRSGVPRLTAADPSQQPLEFPPAAYSVPVMCNLGTREGVTEKDPHFGGVWEGVRAFFIDFRAKGGLIGVAVDPQSSHGCGNSRYLAIPWFDACLAARLPDSVGAMLKPMPSAGAWLAPLLGDVPLPMAQFTGDATAAVWLPDERTAKAWAEYAKDANVSDPTPPPAPAEVRVSATGELTWSAVADGDSGIAGFIIQRDGVEFARVPGKPSGLSGRQVFQQINHSDTPTLPLSVMCFTDTQAKAGESHSYAVITLNSVGLTSEPATATP